MNVELLEKIKQHILAEPKRLYMSTWQIFKEDAPKISFYKATNGKGRSYRRNFPACNTAACIGGWACILSGNRTSTIGTFAKAKEVLELTLEESQRLFFPDVWPKRFRAGAADDGKPETAKITAKRIDYFIKHGK